MSIPYTEKSKDRWTAFTMRDTDAAEAMKRLDASNVLANIRYRVILSVQDENAAKVKAELQKP